ncbi:MAG TPA: ABC transporter substrate-binding protein, partial [Bryobacteraceae bacterium]|nr:ABC transporter substrate-binding protein [Bryobacteraceae bacterium]
RRFLLTSLAGALAAPRAAGAQQRARVWKIGHLGVTRPRQARLSPGLETFLQRLRELGYAEGQNLVFEQRYSDGDVARFPSLAAELIRLDVDLIFALGTPATLAAKQQSSSIPIVMVGGRAPVESGLVNSLARPGGTVTGLIQDVGHDVSLKSLQLLKEAVPRASRIAILSSSQAENTDAMRVLRGAADSLGVIVEMFMVSDGGEIEKGFISMSRDRADAMQALPSHPLLQHRELVVELAARHRIPAMYWFDLFVRLGGLMSYGIDWMDLYRRSANYVDKIFRGAKPGELPIEQPTKFELFVNLKTAKTLGLTIPPSLLLRADQVIE